MIKRLLFLLLLALSGETYAANLLGARFYTKPAKLFVGQSFEIHCEIDTTFGCEVQDLRIRDFALPPEQVKLGDLETLPPQRVTREKQHLTVHHYVARAQALQSFRQRLNPIIQCMMVKRSSAGFFSHLYSVNEQVRAEPFALEALPLPTQGRPENFSGLIGNFKLTGALSQYVVQPGDLITLSLRLEGDGVLGEDFTLPAPVATSEFKCYPPKVKTHTALLVETTQVWSPQSTNATTIGAVSVQFFNPLSERYQASTMGPFKLTFGEVEAADTGDKLRVIDTEAPVDSTVQMGWGRVPRQVDLSLRHAKSLIVVTVGFLVAFFILFTLMAKHPIWAPLIALLILGASIMGGYLTSGRNGQAVIRLTRETECRVAPSYASYKLFTLDADAEVVPLEEAGEWLRIDAAGRRGWLRRE